MDGCRRAGVVETNEVWSGLGEALAAERPWLTRYVARRLSAELRAAVGVEDVVQETFVAALRHAAEFRDGGDGALRRWLATLARNRLCDLARRRSRLKRGGAVAAAECPRERDDVVSEAECPADEGAHGAEERAALAAAVGALREEYREAVRLRYLCGLDVAEVAKRLGRSPGAVAMLCHRAVKRLRRALRGD